MKYLDTYESWGQTFKISRGEDDHLNLWIHQKNESYKIQIEKTELQQLIQFLQNFIEESTNE
jgi:hypothetical protein